MITLIKKYFNWLQKDNPVGDIVRYPELTADGETTLKGVYIIGDLTGIPLLKLATTGAAKKIKSFPLAEEWRKNRKRFDAFDTDEHLQQKRTTPDFSLAGGEKSCPPPAKREAEGMYDIVIVGGGPAGLSAAIEAHKRGYSYIVLEGSDRAFNTIENFPKGKPMFYEPEGYDESDTAITMKGETKEALLEHLHNTIKEFDLHVAYNEKVDSIEPLGADGGHRIKTGKREYVAHKTLLAIGKSGNHRKLGVPGENLPHVYNTLYDPNEFKGKHVLVVGGGDSALESAQLLAKAGATTTLSYRGAEFKRPKPGNIIETQKLEKEGKLTLLMESNVQEIKKGQVTLDAKGTVSSIPADVVFTLIGTQLPYEFFNKCGIKIENTKTRSTYWWMAFAIAFMNIVYFGKASGGLSGHAGGELSNIFAGGFEAALFKTIAWLSAAALVIIVPVLTVDLARNWKRYFKTKWHYIKYGYFVLALAIFLFAFFGNKYFDFNLGNKDPYYWYGFLYTMSIGLFGIRRIVMTKKSYVTKQTILLFLIQALPLFVIPNYVLPWMDSAGLISPWVKETVFLGGEWWRFVGFILAWPLFFWNVFTNEPSMFWLIVSLIQTFVIIPWLVIKYGKGAYCGWICSCGALAETMGDEYRTLAPHGEKAKRLDNAGQVILFSIFVITILHVLGWVPSLSGALAGFNKAIFSGYKIIVDTFLAGTIGVGLYFFFGGRVWCRFFCPLAALMHIYNKFSSWRILADKKKCISCGLCTKSCHMGIDVMGYAQAGRVLDDVECVNCSACINVCPTGVLSFGRYKEFWGRGKKKA